MARLKISPRTSGRLISWVMKALALTWRWRLEDRGGWLGRPMPGPPILWVVWHNRIGMAPQMYWKWFRRQPVAVLTSASKDGEVLAETCRHFTMEAARGSSSRRGAAALRECLAYIKKNRDVCITPDGPRGPRYRLQPGIIRLAAHTGAPMLPLHLRPARAWRLKSWDGFLIPWPFTRVDVILDPPWTVAKTSDEAVLEAERARLEDVMRRGADDYS